MQVPLPANGARSTMKLLENKCIQKQNGLPWQCVKTVIFTHLVHSIPNWSHTLTEGLTSSAHLCLTMSAKVCHPKTKKNKKKHGMEKIWGLGCVILFFFLVFLLRLVKNPPKKKKTNPWDGEDLGGWGVSFCFFLFFLIFVVFSRFLLLLGFIWFIEMVWLWPSGALIFYNLSNLGRKKKWIK